MFAVPAIVGLGLAACAHADTIIFTDTLTTSAWYTNGNLNGEQSTRQAGDAISGGYINYTRYGGGNPSDIQTGRPAASPLNGMFFERTTQRYVSPDSNFNTTTDPLTISFGSVASNNTAFWNQIAILRPSSTRGNEAYTGAGFGLIWNPTGAYELYKNGVKAVSSTIGATITSIGFNVYGGSYGGPAFTVDTILNGSTVYTTTYTATDNYITFGGTLVDNTQYVAYQNLSIVSVPEPSAIVLLGTGIVGLLALLPRQPLRPARAKSRLLAR